MDGDTNDTKADVMSAEFVDASGLDVAQRVSEEVWHLVCAKLDLDHYEGQDIWHAVSTTRAGKDHEKASAGYPLFAFILALHIDHDDKEGVRTVVTAVIDAKERYSNGERFVASAGERVAVKTMYDKVVRALFLNEDAPAEAAWELTLSGQVKLTRAERATFMQMVAANQEEAFTQQVREYMRVSPVVTANAGQLVGKEACAVEVDKIVRECKAEGKQWTDPDWDMTRYPETVLWVDKQQPGWDCTVAEPAGYKRLTEIVNNKPSGPTKALGSLFGNFGGGGSKPQPQKKNKPKVFKGDIRTDDIIQGQIGTCFLLGALGSVASHNPEAVRSMFLRYDVDVGVYGVRFNIDGEWWYVLVDDIFPVDENGELLYAKCRDTDEVWVPILEKAYCKLHTCYEMCDGGNASEAINLFFGGVNGSFPIKRVHTRTPSRYFQVLKEAREKGWLMTTGFKAGASSCAGGKCGEAVSDNGLVAGHAYSVLQVREACGNMMICLKNPWGAGEWTGKWSDLNREGEWTDEMTKALGMTFGDDGSFWMCIEDFVQLSTGVEYARTFGPNWWKTTQYKRFRESKLTANVVAPYTAQKQGELTLEEGDVVEVAEFVDDLWEGVCVRTGHRGSFPDECIKVNPRPVARFDLVGTPDEGATDPMTVVVIMMQPNVKFQRKFKKRAEDGMNYKDTTYLDISMVIVGPDGSIAVKRDGRERILWAELALPCAGVWKIYALCMEATGAPFTLRCFLKGGTCTLTEIDDADFCELTPLL